MRRLWRYDTNKQYDYLGAVIMNSQVIPQIELSVSDRSELWPLREWILAGSNARVALVSGEQVPGRLGTADALIITAVSGVLMTAIQVLPDFIRSRKSNITVKAKVKNKQFEINAENVDGVASAVERMLNE
jgi:hypothetical protein